MPKKAKKRRPWTKAEVRRLKALAKRKTPATNIAWTLKRTKGATRQKAFSLGLSLETRARNLTPQPLQQTSASPSISKYFNGHVAEEANPANHGYQSER